MKKYLKRIMLFIISFSVLFVLLGCGEKETGFKDTIERPNDIPPLADLDYAEYPAKPEGITAGQGSGMPTVGSATTDSEYYKITEADGKITVKFNEVGRWDYIYLPIANFNQEYQNIKITATASNVQKVAFQAVYYEMYDNNYPAVTTLIHDVGDTEQFYIMELGKTKLLDASYYPLEDNLGTQTVIGLCIFIDSNPSQGVVNKNTEIESVFEITGVEFLKDGDEALKDRYVEPSTSVGYADSGYLITKDEESKEYTITKAASAGVWESASLNVTNYSSEYSAFTLNFTTTNVTTFTVELTVSGGQADWAENSKVYQVTNLEDGAHEAYIDFSSVQPTSTTNWDFVPGYYIKNYKISAIKIYLDTSAETELVEEEGTCIINSVKFERMVAEGTTISKGWNAGSANIMLGDDLAVGGIGTVNISWYSTWEYLTMPVLNYEPAEKLVVKFQANEGIDYMGVALGSSSYSLGECVLKSCWYKVGTTEEKQGDLEGMEETVEFDSETNIYTITFDFSDAPKLDKYDGKKVNEVLVTSLRFYFTDPNSKTVFEGTRSIRFISVSFE